MIAAIEDAMIARIRAASGAVLGYRLKKVASYGGEFDEEGLRRVVRDYPAVWIVFGGEPRPEHLGAGQFRHRPNFALICAAKSLRNEAAARHGAGDNVGSYQMLKDMRALFAGQDLGLDIDEFEPGAVRSLFNSTVRELHLSLMAHEFHTVYDAGVAEADASFDEFLTFHADWDIPPLGNVTPPLPATDPDAEDTVNPQS